MALMTGYLLAEWMVELTVLRMAVQMAVVMAAALVGEMVYWTV